MEKIIGSNDFINERCVSFETAKSLKHIYNKICDLAWYQTEQVKPEYEDEYGDTWYTYINDDIVIDVSFYYYEGDYVVDLYVYSSLSKDLEDDGNTEA